MERPVLKAEQGVELASDRASGPGTACTDAGAGAPACAPPPKNPASAHAPPAFTLVADARGGPPTSGSPLTKKPRPGGGWDPHPGKSSPPLALAAWGLPPAVTRAYAARCGVASLYPWQANALASGADGGSLVIAAPTSGGKSLVAEVLLVRRLLATADPPAATPQHLRMQNVQSVPAWKKAMVVLPYAALVAEKAAHLATVLAPAGITVRGYAGGSSAAGTNPLAAQGEAVAILTIEKANACVDALARDGRLGDLVACVVDEAHMLADPGRGAVLEILLAKLAFARPPAVPPVVSGPGGGGGGGAAAAAAAPLNPTSQPAPSQHGLQVIAMSATMAGLPAVCAWLRARLFLTDARATPLVEAAVVGGQVFPVTRHGLAPEAVRSVGGGSTGAGVTTAGAVMAAGAAGGGGRGRYRDPDRLAPLVAEAVARREPTVVFCASRAGAAAAAALLADHLPPLVTAARRAEVDGKEEEEDEPPSYPTPAEAAGWAAAVADLTTATGGAACPALLATLAGGVAFHHAGLTAEERAGVEAAFKGGRITVLAATSTLAAGVNLPAARVVVRSIIGGGGHPLPRAQYLQMVGRAGRAGLAAKGEAFLLAKPAERAAAAALVTAPLPPLTSQLLPAPPRRGGVGPSDGLPPPPSASGPGLADPPLERLFLEAVAGGLADSPADLGALLASTLAAHQLLSGGGGGGPNGGGGLGPLGGAARDALASLRARRLLSYSAPPAVNTTAPTPPPPARWAPTQKGRAVHACGLPTRAGEALFDTLAAALGAGVPLDSPIALVFGVLPDGSPAAGKPALAVRDWVAWGGRLRRLRPGEAVAAAVLGITPAHADAKARLGLEDPATNARHARFLTACAAADVMDEADPAAIAARWGPATESGGGNTAAAPAAPDAATAPPQPAITPGDLQRLRDEVSQRLAMGGCLAAAAGWALAAVPLARLADRAAAGARPELLPLLAIPGLAAPAARALLNAGLGNPRKVARAAEGRLARALLASVRLPREKRVEGATEGAGPGGAWAAWAAGEAGRIQAGARRWVAAETAAEAVAAEAVAAARAEEEGRTTPGWGRVRPIEQREV